MKLKDCFTKKKILILAVAAVVAVGVGFWLHRRYERSDTAWPPYAISFGFDYERSAWPSESTVPYREDEPIVASCHMYKHRLDAPLPNMYGRRGQGEIHPFTLIIKDPDGLVYKWQNPISHEEYIEQVKLWQTKTHGVDFSFDLQDWVPKQFTWKPGLYIVTGFFNVAGRRMEIRGHAFFMKEVPDIFRQTPSALTTNPAMAFKPMLSAEIEADKNAYLRGDIISIKGYLKNISNEPFMVQTRYPFREAQLMVKRGRDFFPNFKYSAPPRLSDFTRIEPGQRILFFQESFVAGQRDPHWSAGYRREWFRPPFALDKYSVWFEMQSDGLFPSDRQPDIGIWTGKVKSNSIKILIRPTPDANSAK